jgi:hypothetical protein
MKTNACWGLALAAAGLAGLTGCGGGGDEAAGRPASTYTVTEGSAQKGPLLRGSWVSINELTASTLYPSGTSFNFEVVDDIGSFKPAAVFTQRFLESTALGYFFDELTGKASSDVVILRSLSDLDTDRVINVNVLTDLANARIRAQVTRTSNPLAFGAARLAAQRDVLRPFFIYNSADLMPGGTAQPASFGELDLARNRSADQALAAVSAVVMQIGKTGSGINRFVNQFEADLANDGLLNNSPAFPVAAAAQINAAVKGVDWAQVAAHLNTFYRTSRYRAADLRQWVDTSGGVDRVIDRFKFTRSDAVVGVEGLSPEYAAGSDDAHQCFSVSGGRLFRNGRPVSGTVKAVAGDLFRVGSTLGAAAGPVTVFIQRSAPASGACPTAAPTSGLTRLLKWTLAAANAAPIARPGAAKTVAPGAFVTLSGSASSDPDGDRLTYAWTLTARPGGSAAVLAGATTVSPTFTADVAGSYVVSLTVDDGKVASAPASVTVTAATAAATCTPGNGTGTGGVRLYTPSSEYSYELSNIAANAPDVATLSWGAAYDGPSGTSTGPLRARLWAVSTSYAGGPISGTVLGHFVPVFSGAGAFAADRLVANGYGTHTTVSSAANTNPPAGRYCLVIVLSEQRPGACSPDSDGYCPVDWLQFGDPVTFR